MTTATQQRRVRVVNQDQESFVTLDRDLTVREALALAKVEAGDRSTVSVNGEIVTNLGETRLNPDDLVVVTPHASNG